MLAPDPFVLAGVTLGSRVLLGTAGYPTQRIMVDAVRQRVPLPILARMGWNLVFDTGLGFVPVVGDAADVLNRANRKNYRLLEQCVREDRHVAVDAKGYLGLAVATVVGFVGVSLVLTDHDMPRLDGLALLARLAALAAGTGRPMLPAILMSGNMSPGLTERALAAGARAVLWKPLQPALLRATMDALLPGVRDPAAPCDAG